jgi:hypothetical protein
VRGERERKPPNVFPLHCDEDDDVADGVIVWYSTSALVHSHGSLPVLVLASVPVSLPLASSPLPASVCGADAVHTSLVRTGGGAARRFVAIAQAHVAPVHMHATENRNAVMSAASPAMSNGADAAIPSSCRVADACRNLRVCLLDRKNPCRYLRRRMAPYALMWNAAEAKLVIAAADSTPAAPATMEHASA